MLRLIITSSLWFITASSAWANVSDERVGFGTYAQVDSGSGGVISAVRIFRVGERSGVHFWKGGVVRQVGLLEDDLAGRITAPGPDGKPYNFRFDYGTWVTLRINWSWTELIDRAQLLHDTPPGKLTQYAKERTASVNQVGVTFEEFRAGHYNAEQTTPFTSCELRLIK